MTRSAADGGDGRLTGEEVRRIAQRHPDKFKLTKFEDLETTKRHGQHPEDVAAMLANWDTVARWDGVAFFQWDETNLYERHAKTHKAKELALLPAAAAEEDRRRDAPSGGTRVTVLTGMNAGGVNLAPILFVPGQTVGDELRTLCAQLGVTAVPTGSSSSCVTPELLAQTLPPL